MNRGGFLSFLSILAIFLFVFIADFFVRREIAASYAEFAERFVKLGDYREITLLLNRRYSQSFSAVALVQGEDQILHLPPEHRYSKGFEGRVEMEIADTGKSLIFWYSFQIAGMTSLVISMFFGLMLIVINQQQARRMRVAAYMERKVEMANLLEGVSHDIRSPLSALNIAVSTMKNVDEDRKALILNASKRINDIADSLLARLKAKNETVQTVDFPKLVAALINEKRLESGNMNIDVSVTGLGVLDTQVNPVELGRVISNLVNNSVQAGAKFLEIHLSRRGDLAVLEVSDDGPGIPRKILKRIGKEPVSSGKNGKEGVGLGLWTAYLFATRNHGGLKIRSGPSGSQVAVSFRV